MSPSPDSLTVVPSPERARKKRPQCRQWWCAWWGPTLCGRGGREKEREEGREKEREEGREKEREQGRERESQRKEGVTKP